MRRSGYVLVSAAEAGVRGGGQPGGKVAGQRSALRTAASLMLNNGVDVLVASQRLGHAHPSITLDVYGHLMPSMQNEVAEVIETLVTDRK